MRHLLAWTTVVCVLGGGAARAEEEFVGQGWSVLSGKTIGAGNTAAQVEVGWPGIDASLLYGNGPRLDLGGKFTFDYGFEGSVASALVPSLKFQFLLRLNLVDTHKFNFGLEFTPGPAIYFPPFESAVFGLTMPVNFVLGFPVSSAIMLNTGLNMPLLLQFFPGGAEVVLPLLFRGGIEYFIDRNMAFTYEMAMGPVLFPSAGVSTFGLRSQIGLAFKL